MWELSLQLAVKGLRASLFPEPCWAGGGDPGQAGGRLAWPSAGLPSLGDECSLACPAHPEGSKLGGGAGSRGAQGLRQGQPWPHGGDVEASGVLPQTHLELRGEALSPAQSSALLGEGPRR